MHHRLIPAFLAASLLAAASCARPAATSSQPTPQSAITGLYVGTIETPELGELPASLDLRMKDGALSGLFELGFMRLDVSAAQVEAGRVHLRLAGFEHLVATIDGTWNRAGIRGSWTLGGDSGTVSIDRFASNTEYRPARMDLAAAEWREDLRYLAKELPRVHGNAFVHVPRSTFADSVAALDARLDTMSAHGVLVAMSRLVSLLGDPFTSGPMQDNPRRYPIWLKAFGDTVHVVQAVAGYEGLIGRQVLGIGPMTVREASRRSWQYRGLAASQYAQQLDPWSLVLAQFIHDAGIVPHADRAEFTLQARSGVRSPITLPALAPAAHVEWVSTAHATPPHPSVPPFSWYRYLPESRTLYLVISPDDPMSLVRAVVDAMFRFEEMLRPDRLVVELRGRPGALDVPAAYLLSRLRGHPLDTPGRLFVALDESVEYGGALAALRFRSETKATLAGEPAMLSPSRIRELRQLLWLPNSQLPILVSPWLSPYLEDDDFMIEPHVLVPLTWEDYEAGRDPVLEWILRQPVAW